jgi:hypothetical protein
MSESAASTDLTLANVVEAARVQKAFPGAPIWEQEALRLARPEQVAQLQIAYKKKAKGGKEGAEGAEEVTRLQKKMGIQKNTITDIEGVNRLAEITTEQTTTDLIGFGVDRRLEKSVQELQRTGRKPTEEEETYMNARGISRKISGTAAAASVQQGVEASKKGLAAAPGGGMEGQAAAAAMGQAKVFADGVDNINKAVGGLSALGETMKKVAEKLDPGEFSKATQGAAKDFLVPVNAFGSSVTKFDNAVSKLVDAVISIAKDTAKDMGKTDSSKTSVNLPGQVNRYQDRQTIPGGKE